MTSPSSPPPVAFRLKRPYADGDEFVAGDGHGISRGGMVLIGAGPRPPGLIVRFEIALRDGTALFRGEGKVVTHRPTADGAHPAGLEIRFTRLDASGKSLVDRVLRARASAATPPPAPAIPDLTPGAPRSAEATRPLPAVVGVGVPEARPSPVEIELTPAPAPNLPPVVAAPPPAPASVDIVIDADDGPPTEPPNPEATVMAPPVALADLSPEPTTAAPAAVPYGPGDPPEPESTDEPTTLVRIAVVSVAPPPPAPPSSGPAASPASAPAPLEPAVATSAPAVARAAAPGAPAPADRPADRASLLGRLRGRGGSVARPPERDTLLVRLRERVRTPA